MSKGVWGKGFIYANYLQSPYYLAPDVLISVKSIEEFLKSIMFRELIL